MAWRVKPVLDGDQSPELQSSVSGGSDVFCALRQFAQDAVLDKLGCWCKKATGAMLAVVSTSKGEA